LAIPNAAPAAAAPMSITFNPPVIGLMPVILLLKYPKMNKQTNVITTENFNAFKESAIKK